MEHLFSIASVFGLLAFAVGLWRLQLKTFKSITLAELPHATLWSLHYLLLNANSGLVICMISIIRSIVRLYLPEKTIKYLIFICTVCIWVLCFIYYQNVFSLLPPLASTIISIGMLQENRTYFTNCTMIHYIFWIVYGLGIESDYQVLASLCGILSCAIGKMRHEKMIFSSFSLFQLKLTHLKSLFVRA